MKESVEKDNNTIQDTFHTSVVMSTYLVAFSVNDFKFKEDFTASGIRVRMDSLPWDPSFLFVATWSCFFELKN